MGCYKFYCEDCNVEYELMLSLSEYADFKSSGSECQKCGGSTEQILGITSKKIYRTAEEIKMKIKKEVDEIVKKARAGDEAVWRDLCGDTPDDGSDY